MPERPTRLAMISRLLCSVIAASWIVGCRSVQETLPSSVRFFVDIPAGRTLGTFAVSADGRWLAYSAESATDQRRRIFMRALDGTSQPDRELPATIGGVLPFFSSDGGSIAYFSQGGLWVISINGAGDPRRIADAPVESAGGTWADDGRLIFAPLGNQGLMTVPAGGGTPAPLTTLNRKEGELEHGWPRSEER